MHAQATFCGMRQLQNIAKSASECSVMFLGLKLHGERW